MSKIYFVCSDVHGFYDIWMEVLNAQGFDINNPDHILISCGDLLDRGNQPLECLKFVSSLPNDRKILIRGNHEDLIEKVFDREYFMNHDYHNGTDITISSLAPNTEKGELQDRIIKRASKNKLIKNYLNSCIDYYELGDYIFVHGWIPVKVNYKMNGESYYYDDNWRNGDWDSARWLNGMEMWNEGIKVPGKTIVCGHWHTSWGHSILHNDGKEFLSRVETYYTDTDGTTKPYAKFEPFIDDGIIAMDACTAYSNQMNCIKIEIE